MYCKLLEETVKELQGEEIEQEIETKIDIHVTAYIPEEYISNRSQKIEVYQDIANITKEEQISEIVDELIDRYGEMPDEMFKLLEIARIKCYAKKLKVANIQQKSSNIVIQFNSDEFLNQETVQKLIEKYKNKILFSAKASPYITLKLQSQKESDILKEILNLLKTMKG